MTLTADLRKDDLLGRVGQDRDARSPARPHDRTPYVHDPRVGGDIGQNQSSATGQAGSSASRTVPQDRPWAEAPHADVPAMALSEAMRDVGLTSNPGLVLIELVRPVGG
jgi:hypothetical protein